MREMLLAMLLTFGVTLTAPAQEVVYNGKVVTLESFYVWDGSSLRTQMSIERDTCSKWALWYFKRGASQTPGSQWGAETEKSMEAVLRDQQEAQKGDENWAAVKAKYHLDIPDSPLVHDNYLGPICVTKAAFDAKPGAVQAIEDASELAGRISSLIGQLRTILNGAQAAVKTGYQGYYLQEGENNQLEEYLNKLQEISEHVHKIQNALMQRLGPTMMQINGEINTITKQLGQAEGNLPAISKLVSSPTPATAITKTWMSKTIISSTGTTTSFQDIPGGFSIRDTSNSEPDHPYIRLASIQFSNIENVVLRDGSLLLIALKTEILPTYPLNTNDGGLDTSFLDRTKYEDVRFGNQQDAQDAYNFLKAQIR